MKILHKITKQRTHILLFALLICISAVSVILYNLNYARLCDKVNSLSDEVFIKCKIESFPEVKNQKTQLRARIVECSESFLVGEGVYISSKGLSPKIQKGDCLQFTALISLADQSGNAGAFDWRNYLKSLDVTFVCFPEGSGVKIIRSHSPLQKIYDMRQNFVANCQNYISPQGAALVSAVITGERTLIDDESREAFQKAGIYHIVAISGLHLNLFVLGVYAAIARIKAGRRKKAMLSFAASSVAGTFVMIFTGFGVSVIRAFVMMLILGGGAVMRREYDSKNALIMAFFIIIIIMPFTVYSVAMWLSLLSTLGVILSIDIIKRLKESSRLSFLHENIVGTTFIISAMTTLLTLPVTASAFGYIPLYGWIANAFVLPFMRFFMGTSILFAFVPKVCAPVFGYALSGMATYITWVAKGVAALPYATIDVYGAIAAKIIFVLASVALFIYLMHKGAFRKAVAIILILAVAAGVFLVYNKLNDNWLCITFADVGQGDCTLVQKGSQSIMIDAGTKGEPDYSAQSISALLRAKNIPKLDAMIITHFHTDHTNIAVSLLESAKSKKLILPLYYDIRESEARENRQELLQAAVKSNTVIEYVASGSVIGLGADTAIEVLSPSDDMFAENNDMSLVLRLKHGKTVAMMFGDAEEIGLTKCLDAGIACDIMKLPHHGGYSKVSKLIIDKCNAKIAVASCGKNNIYNHPDSRILALAKEAACEVYRTDMQGAITVKADKNKNLKISTR
ncbi:MAG: DNA internalization-related competence protein ComEC/Rec2 [Clostridia bacterium]|nr:DNA internalization-related competence protein ComEC/Rec2 [Clostridia bacterium]